MEGNGIENISATSKVPAAALSKYSFENCVMLRALTYVFSEEYPGVVTNTYLSNPFFLPNDFDG